MLRYIIAVFLLASCAAILQAQPLREPTYEMKILKAEELQGDGDYYNALDMYMECYNETKDVFLIPTIAKLNVKLRDFERAEKWYERMVTRPEKYGTKLIDTFYYADVLKTLGKFPEAYAMYQQFSALTDQDSLADVVDNEIIGMEMASKMEPRKDIFVEPLSTDVNTSLTEASPVMGADGNLYYSTFKKKSKITLTADNDDDYHFKIYSSKQSDDGKWSKPDKLTKKINREDYHTGNVSFSADGRIMYFTRSRINGDSILSSDIYYSSYDGDKWTGARPIESVNGEHIATHPSPGAHFGDDVIYFVSDMPGGYGGYDIYYATNRGGNEFSSPVNLGEDINTAGDEVTPFYSDGTLYFSSDGRPGMGGLDVYQTTWDGSKFSTPENVGLPQNSTYDDFYFSWDPEKKKGYLVSNRPYPKKRSSKSETCCDDIFEVAEQDIEINAIATVYDKDKKPLTGAKVILKEIIRGDAEISDSKSSDKGNTFGFPLKVDKQYRVIITHPDFHADSFDVNTVGLLEPKNYERKFFLNPKPKVVKEEVEVFTINEPIRLNRIYYEFDDDRILPESEPDLQVLLSLMQEYSDMVIELSSHTDARGRDGYNQALSQRRAESAKRWLVERGVSPARIEAVGYGESKILNECTDGVSCEEEAHRFNRRTEFKIIAGPTSIKVKKERIRPGTGSIENTDKVNWSKTVASIDDVPMFEPSHPTLFSTPVEKKKLN